MAIFNSYVKLPEGTLTSLNIDPDIVIFPWTWMLQTFIRKGPCEFLEVDFSASYRSDK